MNSFKLQGEYFRRCKAGALGCAGGSYVAGVLDRYQSVQSGWYLQGVYQFTPAWRGVWRHDRLISGNLSLGAALDPDDLPVLGTCAPRRNTMMVDYSPGTASRLRLQFTRDKSRRGVADNQLTLQYLVRLGGIMTSMNKRTKLSILWYGFLQTDSGCKSLKQPLKFLQKRYFKSGKLEK